MVRNQAAEELPDIDDRLVVPETRYEMLEGELIYVPPADGPHATQHSKVLSLVTAHAAFGYTVACDMLTRTSKTSDIAPDVSVYPTARDPVTGKRQLEHLAFEVVSTQSLGYVGRKAKQLVSRGVRRVFAVDIERGRVLEWSRALDGWQLLDLSAMISDPILAVSLPIEPLISAATADDVIAQALLIKGNPVLEAALVRGKAEALLAVLAGRGFAISPDERRGSSARPTLRGSSAGSPKRGVAPVWTRCSQCREHAGQRPRNFTTPALASRSNQAATSPSGTGA